MMAGRRGRSALFERSAEIADKGDDADLFTLAGLGRSRCLQMTGRDADSTAALDEVMVHVVAGRAAPQVIGLAYCVMIDRSLGRFDLPRAREWTGALGRWVDEQRGMVPYRGSCLVHRAERNIDVYRGQPACGRDARHGGRATGKPDRMLR
jgi:hypothetical protein